MEELDNIAILGAVLFVSTFVLAIVILIYLLVMHKILCRLLDPILFREPWFNATQLAMFDSWPLSFIKSMQYMFLIGFPALTLKFSSFTNKNRFTKRLSYRFKGMRLTDVPDVQPAIKVACKVYTILHLLLSIVGVLFFLYLGWFGLFEL